MWRPACGCADACFERITVSGAEAVQASRMGTYSKLPNVTQAGRPVYQRVGSTVIYLYYWSSYWGISSNYTSSLSLTRSTGNASAACPDQATGWQAFTGGAWVSTYPITVVPTSSITASPTTVGKRSHYVHMRPDKGCSSSTPTDT
jgi:hypothetical protein